MTSSTRAALSRWNGQERAVTIQNVTDRSGVFISTISRVVTGCVAVGFATAERIRRQLPS
jgi:hypothetical protein